MSSIYSYYLVFCSAKYNASLTTYRVAHYSGILVDLIKVNVQVFKATYNESLANEFPDWLKFKKIGAFRLANGLLMIH